MPNATLPGAKAPIAAQPSDTVPGLSVRDQLAAQFLAAAVASGEVSLWHSTVTSQAHCGQALKLADLFLATREKVSEVQL